MHMYVFILLVVTSLDCDDCILIERILARGKNSGRADDNIHTALQRIRTYHKYHVSANFECDQAFSISFTSILCSRWSSQPKSKQLTLDFLRDEHVPIVNLDCAATPDGVWEQLRAVGRLMRKAVGRNNNIANGASKSKHDGDLPILR